MKNIIKKAMFILLLLMFSGYTSNSSKPNGSGLIKNDVDLSIMHEIRQKRMIEDSIRKEYALFYDKLNDYKHEEHAIFIMDIMNHALESKSLPSITIAQAVLETGYGKQKKLKYNLFGIKGSGIKTKTKEFIGGKFITITSEFQNFSSYSSAFDKHSEILSKYNFKNDHYVHWAYTIQNSGYATDPSYARKLIHIIERHDLNRLDVIKNLNDKLSEFENI